MILLYIAVANALAVANAIWVAPRLTRIYARIGWGVRE